MESSLQRQENGRFKRTILPWTPERWNDGYYDNRGRFRVYRPDYPRAYKGGYALRAHVVWWLEKGEPHPLETELHHKDGTRDTDNIENLIPLTNKEHQILHKENKIRLICLNCKREFLRYKWRVNQRGAKFCSLECFHSFPKTAKRISITCLECKNNFLVIPSNKKRRFCSNKCSALYIWRERHAHSH